MFTRGSRHRSTTNGRTRSRVRLGARERRAMHPSGLPPERGWRSATQAGCGRARRMRPRHRPCPPGDRPRRATHRRGMRPTRRLRMSAAQVIPAACDAAPCPSAERKATTDGAHRRVSPADRVGGCDGEDPIQNSWSEFTCIQSLRPEAGRRIPVHPTGGRLNRIGIRPSMHVINRKRCAMGRRSSVSESDIHRGRCRCARDRAAWIRLAVPRPQAPGASLQAS